MAQYNVESKKFVDRNNKARIIASYDIILVKNEG